jgi:Xaa-Pro dipeptidase
MRLLATEEGGPVDFARMRVARRHRLLDAMAAEGLDALILGRPGNVRYASGARPLWTAGVRPFAPACVVVAETAAVHLLSVWDDGVPDDVRHDHLFGLSWDPRRLLGALATIPGMARARRVGVDGLTPLFADLLAGTWPQARFVDARPATRAARQTKTADELACIVTATAAAEAGLDAALELAEKRPHSSAADLSGAFLERVGTLGMAIVATDRIAQRFAHGVYFDATVLYAGYEGGVGCTLLNDNTKDAARCRQLIDAMTARCRDGERGAVLYDVWPEMGEPLPDTPIAYGIGLGAEPPLIGVGRGLEEELHTGQVLAVQARAGAVWARQLVAVTDATPVVISRFPPAAP